VVSDLLGLPPLFERTSFLHHPLLLRVDGEKLSKSAGSQAGPLPIDQALIERLKKMAENWR